MMPTVADEIPESQTPQNEALPEVIEQPKWTLLAIDRCDSASQLVKDGSSSCGAQAYVKVVFTSGHDLLFCGHHFHKVEDTIKDIPGIEIIDERERLVENRLVGSSN